MPQVPIIMPQLGESIAEATVVSLLAKPGDTIAADTDVMEVETNKAVMNVSAPCDGTLKEWIAQEGVSYAVSATVGYLEVSSEVAESMGVNGSNDTATTDSTPAKPATAGESQSRSGKTVTPTVGGLPVPAHAAGASYMSPRLKARMAELGLHAADLAGIAGSGAASRVTIEDFEKFMASIEESKTSHASSMRVAVADAMRRSWTRPIATVGAPFILDNLLAHRKSLSAKPGPALYALRALAIALSENSAPAGRLIGDRIIHPNSIDVGFAVEAEDGVLVPVIREADKLPLKELVSRYDDLVDLARRRKLPPAATGGSIATVTNFGTFGLNWATPIPLPEQTLVLGLGAGRKTPHWDDASQSFVPVVEAQLTISFDHRVMDGGAAGRMLMRVTELLQAPESL